MSVKLGIAPIAWSNDDMPELGGDTALEQCLSEASEAGFSGIESGGKFPKKSEKLIPLLEKHNLNLCSGWYGANLRKNSVKEEIDLIKYYIPNIKTIGFLYSTGEANSVKTIDLMKEVIEGKRE